MQLRRLVAALGLGASFKGACGEVKHGIFATGDLTMAIRLLRPLADREDTIGKGETDLPVREMLLAKCSGASGPALKDLEHAKAVIAGASACG